MQLTRRRWLFAALLIGLCFVALEIRLFHLQILGHPVAAQRASRLHSRTETVLAHRGRILDRNGHVLAESVPAVEVYANAWWTGRADGQRDELANRLADALGEDPAAIRSSLERPGYRKVLLRPLNDGESMLRLFWLKREQQLPGIELESTWIRHYPEETLGASVIGFVDRQGVGRGGIEMAFDEHLGGTAGSRTLERDARQRPLFDVDCSIVAPTPGDDVSLTIDAVIQYFVEEELDRAMEEHGAAWACAVALRPATGEILAMANRPTYDPNRYGNFESHANAAITYAYVPGSALKPFVMAACLEAGVLDLAERIDCENGSFVLDGARRINDAHEHAVLTVHDVLVQSSNIGMVKIATRLAPQGTALETQRAGFRKLRDPLAAAGFGKRTGIELPAESSGLLRALHLWNRRYTLASLAFGHEMQVTALQLAAAFNVFANDGRFAPPTLVKSVHGAAMDERPRLERQVFEPATVDTILPMLVDVVDTGTGRRAAIPGFSVAGKTSTAEHPVDREHHTCSFVGFAPASRPEVLVLVVVDRPTKNGRFGGEVAAPAAKEIMARSLVYLGVQPDRDPETGAR